MEKAIYLSGIVFFLTLGCEKDDPPAVTVPLPQGELNLRVERVTSDSIALIWDIVTNADHYELIVGEDRVVNVNDPHYTIGDLLPATEYVVSLTPVNKEGGKGKTASISVKTLKKEVEISRSRVILNSFLRAPLSAIVRIGHESLSPKGVEMITVKVPGKVEDGVEITGTMFPQTDDFKRHFFDIAEEKTFNKTVISDRDSVEIPILGLYADHNNAVAYQVETNSHSYNGTVFIQTEALPEELTIEIVEAQPGKMEPGEVTWMTHVGGNGYDLMFDYLGEIRHIIYARGNPTDMRILRNGNLLIRPFRGNFMGEYTFLGEEIHTYMISEDFSSHHDAYEMPSGNFLVAVNRLAQRNEGYHTVEDCLLELDRQTDEIVNYWDLFELMDVKNLQDIWRTKEQPGDWYHMNGMWYDHHKDEIIVSGKIGGVLKLSRNGENGDAVNQNKEIVWFMPRINQYTFHKTHDATKDHILTAVDASGNAYPDQNMHHEDFHWTSGQHNPSIIPSDDGLFHFFVFNNMHDASNKPSNDYNTLYSFTRSAIVEYAVDEQKNTVRQIWQYGKDSKKLRSAIRSGATWLPLTNNGLMITNHSEPSVEVTRDGEVVFEFNVPKKGWYRGGRINLYPVESAPLR